MQIQRLKRWHWIAASLPIGLLLGYLHVSLDQPAPIRSMTPAQFESALLTPALKPGSPFVRDVTIYPPVDGTYPVRFDVLAPAGKPNEWAYVPRQMEAPTPYPPTANGPAGPATGTAGPYTVFNYLDGLRSRQPDLSYAYAWWSTPGRVVGLWTTGSFVLIGVVIPTLLNALVAAGFGPAEAEPAYDLDRFHSDPKPAAADPQPSAADAAHLDSLLTDLQSGLERSGSPARAAHASAVRVTPPQPLAPADPNEAQDAPATVDNSPHAYRGEFYPTALSAKPGDPASP